METNMSELDALVHSSVVSTTFQQEVDKAENILRPKMLCDFQGQARLKDKLSV
ncbi:MAG: Holliday junction branch migration DNA helicase RuvB, partial [Spirochaetia bacterium]|nr:Holliday junction branch migration DNA helicase RuvB [Spirochaetia bacterium]